MQSERIQFLIENLQESLDIEVKNWLGGLGTPDEKSKLAKEIIALANNGGGYIFIGFDEDAEGHPEVEPNENETESFTQDTVSSVVQRYIDPPCQCQVGYFQLPDSHIRHPVIYVPGEHRTPLWAKRGSPDGQTLKNATVYVRRPGGNSEPARNQDDWERLIERLVKARQSEQLEAIRTILNPAGEVTASGLQELEAWDRESYKVWQKLLKPLPDGDPLQLQSGHWTFAFAISPFNTPSLVDLNHVLNREMPKYSGWPPFTYLHVENRRPRALGNVVQAWLGNDPNGNGVSPAFSDFWRVSRSGYGFLLRPMQEDRPGFAENRSPAPIGPFFDMEIPVYRITELLKYVETLALRFSDENAEFNIILRYVGMKGRGLYDRKWWCEMTEGAICSQSVIESQLSGQVHAIRTNLKELVHTLLTPVFEQFEFQRLPKSFTDTVVSEALGQR